MTEGRKATNLNHLSIIKYKNHGLASAGMGGVWCQSIYLDLRLSLIPHSGPQHSPSSFKNKSDLARESTLKERKTLILHPSSFISSADCSTTEEIVIVVGNS